MQKAIYKKKILITGTTGMLGKQFLSFFGGKFQNIITLNRQDGDLLNFDFVREFVLKNSPDIIIHCIADTNLRRCQKNQQNTLLLHCGLTHCLSAYDSKVVYISSDSATAPDNFYAKTKYLGEQVCMLNNKSNLVVRTNIYGYGSSSKKSLFEWAFKSFLEKKIIFGYSDVYFNAIYTKQLVRAVYDLILNGEAGVINVAGNYSISKHDFLKKVCEVFKFDIALLKEAPMPYDKFINRSKNTTLNVDKLKSKYNLAFNLEDGLKELKKDLEII